MTSSLSADSIREKARSRGEPDWLAELRAQAFARYLELAPPQWRRTDLRGLDVEARSEKAFGTQTALVERRFSKRAGLVHVPLSEAAREYEDLVKPLMQVSPRADKWEALQAALWVDGAFLHVEKGVELDEPVEVPTTLSPEGGLIRDVTILAPTSKATVLMRTLGGNASAFGGYGSEVQVADGANLSLSTLQNVERGATFLAWRRAHLQRDAQLSWVDGQFGAGTTVSVNENLLVGRGARAEFIGAAFGTTGQHMDVTTAALHDADHTESQIDIKGCLTGTAYSANYAITNIGPSAKNSSGHQHQETLLLSKKARADAIPQLDVENNEVSASHGATVGQVDPEQVFYLRSRGFDEQAAKRLIVEGFFEPLLSKIPIEDVREEIRAQIERRMRA